VADLSIPNFTLSTTEDSMSAKSIVLSTFNASRISLALLLACLMVFPEGAAFAQANCPASTSTWKLSGVPLSNITETFGAAVAPTSGGNFLYVIGGENWNGGSPIFPTSVYHKLAGSVASQTPGTWFSNPLWKDPLSPTETVGLARDLCGVVYTNTATSTSYLYTVGGVYHDSQTSSFGNSTNMVWYNQIQSNGNLSTTWHEANSITSGANGLQLHGTAIVTVPGTTNTYLYVIGGSTDPIGDANVSKNSWPTTAVHFAPINSDGSLGVWDQGSPTPVLPNIPTTGTGLYKTCPVVTNGSIYVAGGESAGGTLTSGQVVYATPAADGTFATWLPASNDLNPPDAAQAVVYNKGIILMGGDGGAAGILSTVFHSSVPNNGSLTWSTTAIAALPEALSRNAGATSCSWIFSLGGLHGSSDVNCVYYATAP
jgi:hypothetical protein